MGANQEITTAVTIHNQTYRVRCSDPERVEMLARYLDKRMKEISSQTATVDSLKVAVLTALNIVDDYFSSKDELDSLKRAVTERTQRMAEALEAVGES